MYQKVSTDMNFAQREEEVIKFWRDEDIFKKTVKLREDAPAEDAPAEVTEDFRITVRKQLAALNKKCGYNRAAELINEQTGKAKLTEVALADLPKLMEAAKEETNAD